MATTMSIVLCLIHSIMSIMSHFNFCGSICVGTFGLSTCIVRLFTICFLMLLQIGKLNGEGCAQDIFCLGVIFECLMGQLAKLGTDCLHFRLRLLFDAVLYLKNVFLHSLMLCCRCTSFLRLVVTVCILLFDRCVMPFCPASGVQR